MDAPPDKWYVTWLAPGPDVGLKADLHRQPAIDIRNLQRQLLHVIHERPIHRAVQVRQVIAGGFVNGDTEGVHAKT